ncbi:hypothetical protein DEDE109153_12075 [Deinococcus deserti]
MNTLWLVETSVDRLQQLRQEARHEALVRQARRRVSWDPRLLFHLPAPRLSSAPCLTC